MISIYCAELVEKHRLVVIPLLGTDFYVTQCWRGKLPQCNGVKSVDELSVNFVAHSMEHVIFSSTERVLYNGLYRPYSPRNMVYFDRDKLRGKEDATITVTTRDRLVFCDIPPPCKLWTHERIHAALNSLPLPYCGHFEAYLGGALIGFTNND